MAPRKEVVAVTPGGKITEDMIVGWLTMYSVPDRPVVGAKLLKLWAEKGLDPDMLPEARQPLHTFQTAVRSVETRRRTNGSTVEIKVDEVVGTPHEWVYQVTLQVRDLEERIIEHPKGMRVIFDRRTNDIKFDKLEGHHLLSGVETRILDQFQALSNKVPASKVRNAVRAYLRELGATNLRKKAGGVYITPKSTGAKETLDSIAAVLDETYKGDGELYTIPLADDEAQRNMVEKHFTMNASELIDEQIGKVTSRLKQDRTVRKDLVANVVGERKRLGEIKAQYSDLLRTDLDEVEAKMALLDEQIEALLERAGEPDDTST